MDGGGENAFPSLVALKILKEPQTANRTTRIQPRAREKLKLSELPRVSHVTVEEGNHPRPQVFDCCSSVGRLGLAQFNDQLIPPKLQLLRLLLHGFQFGLYFCLASGILLVQSCLCAIIESNEGKTSPATG